MTGKIIKSKTVKNIFVKKILILIRFRKSANFRKITLINRVFNLTFLISQRIIIIQFGCEAPMKSQIELLIYCIYGGGVIDYLKSSMKMDKHAMVAFQHTGLLQGTK